MARAYIERHIQTLSLAHACVQLGARVRTTTYVTGMSYTDLSKFYWPGEGFFRAGRLPFSPDWSLVKTNILDRAELSIFAAIFTRVLAQHANPAESLVAAYRLYIAGCAVQPRVSFDRAFDVVCHLKGIWTHQIASLALYPCSQCRSLNLSSIGDENLLNRSCAFCRLLNRYGKDPRIRSTFPRQRCTPEPPASRPAASGIRAKA